MEHVEVFDPVGLYIVLEYGYLIPRHTFLLAALLQTYYEELDSRLDH